MNLCFFHINLSDLYSPVFSGENLTKIAEVCSSLSTSERSHWVWMLRDGVHPNPPMTPRKPWWGTAVKVSTKWLVNICVSKNRGTPKSSILVGFSIINHPFWGTPIFGNTHMLHNVSLEASFKKKHDWTLSLSAHLGGGRGRYKYFQHLVGTSL